MRGHDGRPHDGRDSTPPSDSTELAEVAPTELAEVLRRGRIPDFVELIGKGAPKRSDGGSPAGCAPEIYRPCPLLPMS
jgi:hypothetical protein